MHTHKIHDRSLTDELILLSAIIGFVWLVLLALFAAIYCHRCFPCCRRLQERYYGTDTQSRTSQERNRESFDALSSDERRKVLKVLFPPTPYSAPQPNGNIDAAAEDVENQTSNNKNNDNARQTDEPRRDLVDASQERITVEMAMDHDRSCSICLQNYVDGEDVVVSRGCPHMFHNDCVMAWLDGHNLCPCCRKEMMTDEDMRSASLQLSDQPKS